MNTDYVDRIVLDTLNKQRYYAMVVTTPLGFENGIALMKKSSNRQTTYYDGSYDEKVTFEIVAKHENQLEAYQTLLLIMNELNQINSFSSSNKAYAFQGIQILKNHYQVCKDEKFYHYSVEFSTDLYIKERY